MRIVSQDGMIDVPYDLAALSIGSVPSNKSSTIYVRSKLLDEKPCVFADYSTKDKALKAMEMLRDAYTSSCYSDNGYDYSAQINRPYLFVENMVFHFPQDGEIAD